MAGTDAETTGLVGSEKPATPALTADKSEAPPSPVIESSPESVPVPDLVVESDAAAVTPEVAPPVSKAPAVPDIPPAPEVLTAPGNVSSPESVPVPELAVAPDAATVTLDAPPVPELPPVLEAVASPAAPSEPLDAAPEIPSPDAAATSAPAPESVPDATREVPVASADVCCPSRDGTLGPSLAETPQGFVVLRLPVPDDTSSMEKTFWHERPSVGTWYVPLIAGRGRGELADAIADETVKFDKTFSHVATEQGREAVEWGRKQLKNVKRRAAMFLMEYIPDVKVEKIEGENDGFVYTIDGINLSSFTLTPENVEIELLQANASFVAPPEQVETPEGAESASGSPIRRMSDFLADGGSFFGGADPSRDSLSGSGTPKEAGKTDGASSENTTETALPSALAGDPSGVGEVLRVTARDIAIRIPNVDWTSNGKRWPNPHGEGIAYTRVQGGAVNIVLRLERKPVEGQEGKFKPGLGLASCNVTIETVNLQVRESISSKVNKALLSEFQEVLKERIAGSLTETLKVNRSALLGSVNEYISPYLPLLLETARVPLEYLPLGEADGPPPGKTDLAALGRRLHPSRPGTGKRLVDDATPTAGNAQGTATAAVEFAHIVQDCTIS